MNKKKLLALVLGSPDERFHNCGRLRGREHSGICTCSSNPSESGRCASGRKMT